MSGKTPGWARKAAEECPDGPRYRAIGNGMCVEWIFRRINQKKENKQ